MRAAIAVACVIALAGCKKVGDWSRKATEHIEQRAAEERAQDAADARAIAERVPDPVPTGPGLPAGRYRIVDIRAEAAPTHHGRPWDDLRTSDGGIEPDLGVAIRVDGVAVGSCKMADNTASGRCRLDVEIVIDAATQIELTVVDRDTVFDNEVGTATLTDPSRWGVAMALPMTARGELKSATIFLAPTPTWWDLYQHRIVAVGIGLVLALAITLGFRRQLMAPPRPPDADRAVPRRLAIWDIPLLLLASGAAVVETIGALAVPDPWGAAIVWGAAAAALVFTVARCVAARQFGRREAGLVALIAGAVAIGFLAPFARFLLYVLVGAAVLSL